MALQSAPDVPLLITSPNSSSERRISPSWSIAHLKTRLEPVTGVPASAQQLSLRVGSQDAVPLTAPDEEHSHLAAFPLQPYAEIVVSPLPTVTARMLPPWSLKTKTYRPLAICHLPHLSFFPPSYPLAVLALWLFWWC